MKKNLKAILKGLLANPKRSDRAVATSCGVSQPTVTRARNRLEKEGVIQSYEIVPDLEKLGFEIIAFSMVEPTDRVKHVDSVIYAIGDGGRMLVMSVHKNFSEFDQFARGLNVKDFLLVPATQEPMKPLSFKHIPL